MHAVQPEEGNGKLAEVRPIRDGVFNCTVCDGKGFLQAAPVANTKAAWNMAVAVPCWSCAGVPA
jgi:hypothetical protein